MEQGARVPASVYNNKSLNTQSGAKQETPKYQTKQNLTYQFDSLRKEINKELFAKAHPLGGKTSSCPRIKHSNSKTFSMDGVETRVLLSNFAQQLRCKNAVVPDV